MPVSKRDPQGYSDNFIKFMLGIDPDTRPCPLCSKPNWSIYHTKDNPCPKQATEENHEEIKRD